MTSQRAPVKSQDLQQRLWEIEAKIVDIFVEFGKYRNRAPRDSAVLTFFYIHKTLTQSQLRALSAQYLNVRKLRGFSSGSISTLLNDMEKKGIIAKQRETTTNSFQYRILGSLKQINLSQLGILLYNISSLNELKRRIEVELETIELHSPDRQNILVFVKELSELITLYDRIYKYLSAETVIPPISPEILTKRVADFFKTIPDPTPTPEQIANRHHEVSPTVMRTENLITNFFITRDRQMEIRGEVTSRVLAQFIIHRELTQEQLRQLTGLSMGAVSQAVRALLEQEIIRTISASDRSIHYQLRGLINAFQTLTQSIIDKLDQLQGELERMFQELEAGKAKFQKNANYTNLLEFLRDLIDFFQLSKRFAEYWKNLSN